MLRSVCGRIQPEPVKLYPTRLAESIVEKYWYADGRQHSRFYRYLLIIEKTAKPDPYRGLSPRCAHNASWLSSANAHSASDVIVNPLARGFSARLGVGFGPLFVDFEKCNSLTQGEVAPFLDFFFSQPYLESPLLYVRESKFCTPTGRRKFCEAGLYLIMDYRFAGCTAIRRREDRRCQSRVIPHHQSCDIFQCRPSDSSRWPFCCGAGVQLQ